MPEDRQGADGGRLGPQDQLAERDGQKACLLRLCLLLRCEVSLRTDEHRHRGGLAGWQHLL